MDKYIAITGGIGSGKSTVSEILKKEGFTVFSADEVYSELLADEAFADKISLTLGIPLLEKDGKKLLDRKKISAAVFADKEKLHALNSLTHPAIMDEIRRRAEKESGVVFAEIPLLYEGGFESVFDEVWVVTRNAEDRFASVTARDGKTLDEVKKIAENQFGYDGLKPDCKTIVIKNDGSLSDLEKEIFRRL